MSCHDLSQEARRLRRANRRLRRAIRRLSEDEGDSAEFVLSNPSPAPKPWRGGEPENTRQTVLVAGMDCQPGQQDLFETDGTGLADVYQWEGLPPVKTVDQLPPGEWRILRSHRIITFAREIHHGELKKPAPAKNRHGTRWITIYFPSHVDRGPGLRSRQRRTAGHDPYFLRTPDNFSSSVFASSRCWKGARLRSALSSHCLASASCPRSFRTQAQ